ncbi:MAG: tRNA (N6-threonylcarbamoyladenosine(37)-N6)-methyltransferase TrmO [Prevotella sp.]
MEINPIAYFHSPFTTKFGIPRQSGLVENLRGRIVFCDDYRNASALRGLSDFDYLWLIWGFSANVSAPKHPTVRPPRLGGNRRMGVFATRSPFRPNNLGLSSVRIEAVETDPTDGPVIIVSGADLMDGTPIYDIKPYIEPVDSHIGVRSGFTDTNEWQKLTVEVPDEVARLFDDEGLSALVQTLELDPRPHYHDDGNRTYGMPFAGYDVRFRVADGKLRIVDALRIGADDSLTSCETSMSRKGTKSGVKIPTQNQ